MAADTTGSGMRELIFSIPGQGEIDCTCRLHLLCSGLIRVVGPSSVPASRQKAATRGTGLHAGSTDARPYVYSPRSQRPKIQRHG